jgi:hypothetical protein
MSLDKSKLLNVQLCEGGYTAGCPVCGRNGSDHSRNHLKVWNTGAYSCAVHPGDDAHNKAIFAIAGIGGGGVAEVEAPPPRQLELPKTWPVDVLDNLVKDHSYWKGRGISEETVASFRGGVATEHQMKNRYVFPIFDSLNEDRLIGFSGRRVDGQPDMPWKIIGSKSLFIFGDLDECESTHRVILVESIGDLLMLREHGVKDVLCLFGVSMSQTLLAKVIALNPTSILISTNRDKGKVIAGVQHYVGQEAAEKIKRTFSKFFDDNAIHIVFPPERDGQKDWGTATKEEIEATFSA